MRRVECFAVIVLIAMLASCAAGHKKIDLTADVPVDTMFRHGQLPNGMTYYIRRNVEPKERAEFYIVQNVGAILEDDNQNGLAHFLEHMAFNGTKNFPKKGMLDYFERNGVKFGSNINAFTSLDETVYNLSDVPTTRGGLVDSALLVLHDWSHFLLLEPSEIESERGVIREEWRTRRSPEWRMMLQAMPIIYKGSKYAQRDVIGDINIINGCSHEALTSFYEKWYRPDLQAIVVVGDIDVDSLEMKIKSMFADIPAPANPAKREYFDVPDNIEPLISVASDPEASTNMVTIFYKHPVVDRAMKTYGYLRSSMVQSLITQMLANRLGEIVQKPNPPFVYAGAWFSPFVRTKDAFSLVAMLSNDGMTSGIKGLIREAERARRFGFTATEIERAKSDYLRSIESQFQDRNKQKNGVYVWQAVEHFLTGEPIPGIETMMSFAQDYLPSIAIAELNECVAGLVTDNNMVVSLTGAMKKDVILPDAHQIQQAIDEVKAETIEPYVDEHIAKPLVDNVKRGRVKKVKEGAFETVEYTMSNGARVVFKKTDFKDDEVLMTAFSKGGLSVSDVETLPSASFATELVSNAGVGDFKSADLEKALAGRKVSVSPVLGSDYEGFMGSASPKDFETMLQLVYLYFTDPRYDEENAATYLDRVRSVFMNMSSDPNIAFKDSVNRTITGHSPRMLLQNIALVDRINYNKAFDFYKDRFADASDFVFVFTGNINHSEVKGLVERYIGGLPTVKREDGAKDTRVRTPKGRIMNHFKRAMETPKASVCIVYSADVAYNLENKILASFMQNILDNRYTEVAREKEGGTYGVGVGAFVSNFPVNRFMGIMQFTTDPAKRDKLVQIVHSELGDIIASGPLEDDFNRVREYLLKEYNQNINENRYWQGVIVDLYKDNLDTHTEYQNIVNSVTRDRVRAFAESVYGQSNVIEVVMMPETVASMK